LARRSVADRARPGVRSSNEPLRFPTVQPLAVLLVLPIVVGVVAALCFSEARSATLAAALASVLSVSLSVCLLGGMDRWSWLAAFMVSPLTVAFTVAAVVVCHGRLRDHARRSRHA
jgi:hypothetical protein